MHREHASSGSPWEATVGYSRAVRVGRYVHVAGTAGVDENGRPVSEDAYGQARRALEIVREALEQLGATLDDVVRTRMYMTNIDDWERVGKAHAECFANVRPAATMVEVARLISPGLLVEIEVDACVGDRDD